MSVPAAGLLSPSCASHPPLTAFVPPKKNGAQKGAVLAIVAFSLHDDPAPPSAGAIVAEAGIADIVEVADHGSSIGRPGRRVNAAAAGRFARPRHRALADCRPRKRASPGKIRHMSKRGLDGRLEVCILSGYIVFIIWRGGRSPPIMNNIARASRAEH